MFTITENTVLNGINETGLSVGHINHCIYCRHGDPEYSYFGKYVRKGTVDLYTKIGTLTIRFDEKNGWARSVTVVSLQKNV